MYYVALVLVWASRFALGVVAAMVLWEYLLLPDSLPEIDAHERITWPTERM